MVWERISDASTNIELAAKFDNCSGSLFLKKDRVFPHPDNTRT
jgi:hypothetical protein